jgi:hypothetical protein
MIKQLWFKINWKILRYIYPDLLLTMQLDKVNYILIIDISQATKNLLCSIDLHVLVIKS